VGQQGPDPGRLPEPGVLRRRRLRDRRRGPALLLPAGGASQPGPGGRPGRDHRQPDAVPADRRPGRPGPPRPGPGPDGGGRVRQPGPGRGRQTPAAGAPAAPRERPLPLLRRRRDPHPAGRPCPRRRPRPGRVGGPAAGRVRGRPADHHHPTARRPAPGRGRRRAAAGWCRGGCRPGQPGPGQRGGGGHGRRPRLRPLRGQPGHRPGWRRLPARLLVQGLLPGRRPRAGHPDQHQLRGRLAGHGAGAGLPGRLHRAQRRAGGGRPPGPGPGHRRVRQHLLRPADGPGGDAQRDRGGQAHGDHLAAAGLLLAGARHREPDPPGAGRGLCHPGRRRRPLPPLGAGPGHRPGRPGPVRRPAVLPAGPRPAGGRRRREHPGRGGAAGWDRLPGRHRPAPGRQDRHHHQLRRRLVHRLHPSAGHLGLGRRPGPADPHGRPVQRRAGLRWHLPGPDLPRLHGRRPAGQPVAALPGAAARLGVRRGWGSPAR
jgi:hypothetical protein